jgi:hypothetical protein
MTVSSVPLQAVAEKISAKINVINETLMEVFSSQTISLGMILMNSMIISRRRMLIKNLRKGN